MTIEYENTLNGNRSIADYRFITDESDPKKIFLIKKPIPMLLSQMYGEKVSVAGEITIALPKSPDEIEIVKSIINPDSYSIETDSNMLVKDDINKAHLVSIVKEVRVVWRETKPDDYPNPEKGLKAR